MTQIAWQNQGCQKKFMDLFWLHVGTLFEENCFWVAENTMNITDHEIYVELLTFQ